ncbi:MAG TPA: CDP-alcohol phosphatidyltransferase family protein [Nitrospinota bacterium]|jgi:phosphatidylglycerophosphate synthase|nr:CDP-alcohol phosphatidyltransferase family protein [Nitrospinota bacterium]
MNKVLVIPLSDPVSVEYLYFSSIAGRTFIERLCWISKKAGYEDVIVLYDDNSDGLKKSLVNAPGQVFPSLEKASAGSDSIFVFLKPDIFPTADFLKDVPVPDKKDTLYLMGENSPVMSIGVSDISRLSQMLSSKPNLDSLQETLSKKYPFVTFDLDNRKFYTIADHGDISNVEKSLYHGLIKETDGFMARHFNRKISLAITRQLINTSLTPNQMSLISIGIGLIGALLLSFPIISLQVFGALLFLLHSITDGCDGELARLKYMESRWGGLLDYWGDNIVHAAVFLGIGLAWKKATGLMIALWCSGFAIAGSLLTAGLVYAMTMRSGKDDGPVYTSTSRKGKKDRWVIIADFLSRRDFIYLVVVLAIFGKLHWFLVLAAIGAPAFFLFTLWNNFK